MNSDGSGDENTNMKLEQQAGENVSLSANAST